MVTAVVIPILCLYFYWITRKEMKLNDQKWLESAEVKREAVLTGEIKSFNQERQRFYYHRYILVYELTLQTETKFVKAKKIIPLRNNIHTQTFSVGEVIRVYGIWNGNYFQFNEYTKVKKGD